MKRITIEIENMTVKRVKAHVIEHGYKSIKEFVLKSMDNQIDKDKKGDK